MSLKDKTIVVTGGSRGLGLGLVEALVDAGRQGDGRRPRRRCARSPSSSPARRRHDLRRRDGRGRRPPHPCRGPPGHPGAERRRDAADGSARPAELGGFHRDLGDRRQGRALLDAGGAQPAAQAGKPRPRGIERRGRERIAALGRLCRRQAHALVHGQIRQWGRRAEGPGHPLPGDRAAADHRRDRGRRRRRPAPTRARWASSARRTWPGSARRCRPASSATTWSRCWTIRSMPRASPSA